MAKHKNKKKSQIPSSQPHSTFSRAGGNAPLAHEVTGHSNEVQAHEHAPPELSSSAEETEDEESYSSGYDSGSNGDSSDLDPEITPSCPVTTNGPPSHATPPRDAAEDSKLAKETLVPGTVKSNKSSKGRRNEAQEVQPSVHV
ncbi:hypothetical protein OIU79_021199 [Salix purpurea]|uniref:Uncharacterized protein n=1 Tax=Salix purpurea TaxID=77065 RepID=A0A9Q1AGR4_SALPP|nr:hypothetical protein OIU79_021199 [Salix purpurea]